MPFKKLNNLRVKGIAYLDSVEGLEQICINFIHSLSFKFFLNRKGALWGRFFFFYNCF